MSRLWTIDNPEVDTELNATLADLGSALSAAVFDGKPVVFHDAGGGFAPVIRPDGRVHIHLHATPLANPKGPTPDREARIVDPFPGGVFTSVGHHLARLASCSSRELESHACEVTGAKNIRLVQRKDDTLFLLVRPGVRTDNRPLHLRAICPTVATELLVHVALLLADLPEVRGRAPYDDAHPYVAQRPTQLMPQRLSRLEREHPRMRELVEVIRSAILGTSLALVLNNNNLDPAAGLQNEIDRLRREENSARDRVEAQRASLRQLQAQRLDQQRFEGRDELTARIRDQLMEIRGLPQVLGADIATREGSQRLRLLLKPIGFGQAERSSPGTALLAPLELLISLNGTDRPVALADIYAGGAAHPHVRGSVCLGSISENVTTALRAGDLVSVVQLMLGFLQTFNINDQWGQIGPRWPGFNVVLGPGNAAQLPPPPGLRTTSQDAPGTSDDQTIAQEPAA